MSNSSWVTPLVFPLAAPMAIIIKRLRKDHHPPPFRDSNAETVCTYLAEQSCIIQKAFRAFLYAFLALEMDLFAYINHADPTKVRIGEREVGEEEIMRRVDDSWQCSESYSEGYSCPTLEEKEKTATVLVVSQSSPQRINKDHGTSCLYVASTGEESPFYRFQGCFEQSTAECGGPSVTGLC
ncbi:hypothetical protein Tco_0677875 [Tanacetum coccineum]|uniref:Uncharacterized protein n=1 Tax=Tanacetum coccineum TaxID=301880 RepID=A0ABQ4XDG1_9ASTR